jgi:hypothetical protein
VFPINRKSIRLKREKETIKGGKNEKGILFVVHISVARAAGVTLLAPTLSIS